MQPPRWHLTVSLETTVSSTMNDHFQTTFTFAMSGYDFSLNHSSTLFFDNDVPRSSQTRCLFGPVDRIASVYSAKFEGCFEGVLVYPRNPRTV